ncbi:zinc finger CCCH domain protein [Medicago truncatula]|uniref:Zinc finger CCCH domain protein n=1 Tax=Medicago truncatula TaxID=3880 RepID=G7JVB0_MEDTR|nr:zinc finger CCCH domain protein [Medicago truncatula]
MVFPDNIPTSKMSPPQFATSNNDIVEVRPRFPMKNENFEQHSTLYQPHSLKRARISDNNRSNALICLPPKMVLPPSNRATHIFYKTRICTKFRFGTCRNGKDCNFAHGVEELRQPPGNWLELVSPCNDEQKQLRNWEEDQKFIHKMKLCRMYSNGEKCFFGSKCNFRHEDPAKSRDHSWKSGECSSISIGTIGSSKSFGDGIRAVNKPARGTYWKNNMCFRWQHQGSCPFGEDCHFSHGEAVAIANSTKAINPTSRKALTGSGNDAYAPTTFPARLVAKEEEQAKKMHLLWLKLNKINRVYGDWIDDSLLVLPNLPSAVEN